MTFPILIITLIRTKAKFSVSFF